MYFCSGTPSPYLGGSKTARNNHKNTSTGVGNQTIVILSRRRFITWEGEKILHACNQGIHKEVLT